MRLKTFESIRKEFLNVVDLKRLFPDIFTAIQIYLTIPVSSTACERAFSSLKRLKSWLRASMGQNRLSALALLEIESRIAKLIVDYEKAIDTFASMANRRIVFF